MITRKEVEHVVKLSRIGVKKSEIERLQKDLFLVLKYVEILKKADVSNVKPTSHPFNIENVMREDEVKKESRKFLDGFLKVKSIF